MRIILIIFDTQPTWTVDASPAAMCAGMFLGTNKALFWYDLRRCILIWMYLVMKNSRIKAGTWFEDGGVRRTVTQVYF